MSEVFDFVVRIGYGKALCQFLDSADAVNLAMVDTQCREIIPIYRKRWGFEPAFAENMWRHITMYRQIPILSTPYLISGKFVL